jgi:CRP/FNR family transcriptional regulator
MTKTIPVAGRRVPCEQCPLRAKPIFRSFSSEELDFVRQFKSGELNAKAGSTVLLEGTQTNHLYTLLSGWAFRYKTLADGRRQILNYLFPGDFIGLQPSLLDEMQYSVEVLTDSVLCIFPRDKLWNLYNSHPSLAFDITWLAARSEQILDESLVSVGRRTALERVAFLLLYLYLRAEELGLAKADKVQFPFTQQHVADTLGMSLVHANKTIRRLMLAKLIRWKDKVFEILDRDKLIKAALYDMREKRPRPFI